MSLTASGSLAKTLTYRLSRGKTYALSSARAKTTPTGAQTSARATTAFLGRAWLALRSTLEPHWPTEKGKPPFSPYNYYIGWNTKRWATFQPPQKAPTPSGTDYAADTTAAATPASNTTVAITTTTTDTAGPATWATAIFRSATTGATPSQSNHVQTILSPPTTPAIAIDRPPSNGTWYYKTKPISTDGQWGATSNETSATIPPPTIPTTAYLQQPGSSPYTQQPGGALYIQQ